MIEALILTAAIALAFLLGSKAQKLKMAKSFVKAMNAKEIDRNAIRKKTLSKLERNRAGSLQHVVRNSGPAPKSDAT